MSPNPNARWVPNSNVSVNDVGELIVTVELAAMTKEDIEIAIAGPRLTVSGFRADPESKNPQHLLLEINHGRFESVIEVPEAFDLSRARSTYQNGMLRIVAPGRV